ncbi:putative mannitol dehydrogenase [Morella rubra]|uniref:Putative mannitol dehydrogenase n=1 Tax=Morella rubra TaxID=262757 RepID=A0A6A1UP60_9ROSI|nr:putative mannitol dehydrogenase [Morella rubra]
MEKSPEQEHPKKAFGWAARDPSGVLSPFKFSRRQPETTRNVQGSLLRDVPLGPSHGQKTNGHVSPYPLVPGHEIAGESDRVGSKVEKFKVGDKVGVGCVAFGAKVTVISTSASKKDEALQHLGADSFLISRDQEQMQAAKNTFDGILDTVSAVHSLLPLIDLLKSSGKLVLLGAVEKPIELPVFPLITGRKMVAGSATGGIKEIQEMIEFAAKHNITADIEVISMEYVNTAMERLAKGDVRYRFVIDIGNTLPVTKC